MKEVVTRIITARLVVTDLIFVRLAYFVFELQKKAVYTEGSVECCWAGVETIPYTHHQAPYQYRLSLLLKQPFYAHSTCFCYQRPTD